MDPALWDFHPSPNSTLLGAGDPDGFVPTVDFDGVARDGSAPDVGAYEYDREASAGGGAAMGLPLLLPWRRRRYPTPGSAGSSRHRRLRATSSR